LHGVTRSSVIELAKDRGLDVQERKITIDEWRDGVAAGDITEAFACGTAAVITPIGELKADGWSIASPSAGSGDVAMSSRQELLGIQTGAVEDSRGWLTRLA
ncbi:aminotransferase class IV, partial [Arthrobacter sp.]|uniref:aminotransferase class IV n=1 Tax=Arthrobacter sp. TaxID=1667 RepID=UPI003395898F